MEENRDEREREFLQRLAKDLFWGVSEDTGNSDSKDALEWAAIWDALVATSTEERQQWTA